MTLIEWINLRPAAKRMRADVEALMAVRRARRDAMPKAAPLTHGNGVHQTPVPLTAAEEARLGALAATFSPQPDRDAARSVLRAARDQGIDGRKLYDLLARTRPDHWLLPMPTWEDIAPEQGASP
jgi:hypothetical protein